MAGYIAVGLMESNDILPPILLLISSVGWLPNTRIGSSLYIRPTVMRIYLLLTCIVLLLLLTDKFLRLH